MTDLGESYRIIRSLGTGAGGETFEAEDTRDGSHVALKRLTIANASDWKKVDLFQREARVLANLKHPSIPSYRDSFLRETAQGPVFHLVHDFAPGQSLLRWVENGWRADEAEVLRIGAFLLDVLAYLHALSPAVIHRDIKPANVIRADDGRLWLVDFGAVRDVATTLTGGSTVVGTYGYMAPEQFRGHAVPSSDIYGVGATLLFLLGGKPPTDYPQEKLKVSFRGQLKVSPFLARWIDRALEPAPEDRFPSASEALAALRGQKSAMRPASKAGSGKRVALLGGLLGVIVLGAGGFIGRDLYMEQRRTKSSNTSTAPGGVARLPERALGSAIAHEVRVFEGRHTHLIFRMALSPDEKVIATGSDAVIKLWDTESHKELRSIGAHGAKIGGLHFLSDNKRLVSAAGRTLKIWDYTTGKELQSADLGTSVQGFAATRDDHLAFMGGFEGSVRVWDITKSAETARYPFGTNIYCMALSPDDTRLAVGGADGTVKIYAVPSGQLVTTWRPHMRTVNELAYSPDASLIASAGDDGRAVLTALDSTGRTRLDSDYRNADETWGVAFSPDGKLLATMSKDKTVGFISVPRRQRLQLDPFNVYATHGIFSKDGGRFFVGAGSGVASQTIARRGMGTTLPEPRPDAAEAPKPRDDDHRRYLEIMELVKEWPNADLQKVADKTKEASDANPKSPYPFLAIVQLGIRHAYLSYDDYDQKRLADLREPLTKAEALGKPLEFWTTKASLERVSKNIPAAREAIRQAFSLSPRDPNAVMSEAHIDVAEGKLPVAAASLAELIRSTKRFDIFDAAIAELASIYRRLGDLDAAEECYRKLIERRPNDPWRRGNYASFLIQVGEPEKGMSEAKAALAIRDYPVGRAILASAHREIGDRALWERDRPDEALQEYSEALSLDPLDARTYYSRAAYHRAQAYDRRSADDVKKARADLTKAMKLYKQPWPAAQRALEELDAVEALPKAKK